MRAPRLLPLVSLKSHDLCVATNRFQTIHTDVLARQANAAPS